MAKYKAVSILLSTIDRTQKVKDVRTEAAKEIEAYKSQKAKDFKKFEADTPTLLV